MMKKLCPRKAQNLGNVRHIHVHVVQLTENAEKKQKAENMERPKGSIICVMEHPDNCDVPEAVDTTNQQEKLSNTGMLVSSTVHEEIFVVQIFLRILQILKIFAQIIYS